MESSCIAFITSEEVDHFRESGFVKLQVAISDEWILRLRDALERIRLSPGSSDAVITAEDGNSYFVNAGNLCFRNESVFAELMGSPMLLSITEAICGADFFPIQEFAVIKNRGDQSPVLWHQDVNNGQPGRTIMVGIYLDAADENNGALRVIPGSHKSKESICILEKQPSVVVDMKPGGILVHDLMIAHSSGVLESNPQRRVLYFEFMSSVQAIEENIYTREFVELRTRLIPVAIKFFGNNHAEEEQFQWQHPERARFGISSDLESELKAIYEHNMHVRPANYCFDFHSARA